MNIKKILIGSYVCTLLLTSHYVSAAAISDRSLLAISQSNLDLNNPHFELVTANDSALLSHALIEGEVEGYGNLQTGKVGAKSSAGHDHYQSMSGLFDTLTFSTPDSAPTQVSFSLTLDGKLMSDSAFRHPYGQARVGIYDITGADHWLEVSSPFGTGIIDMASPVDTLTEVATIDILADMDGFDTYTDTGGRTQISNLLSRNGILHDIELMLTGSFIADPLKTYGISLVSNVYAGDGSLADFLGTSSFAFTDLGGAVFQSASGEFLSAVAPSNPVPAPATIWLLLSGITGLLGTTLVKNQSASAV